MYVPLPSSHSTHRHVRQAWPCKHSCPREPTAVGSHRHATCDAMCRPSTGRRALSSWPHACRDHGESCVRREVGCARSRVRSDRAVSLCAAAPSPSSCLYVCVCMCGLPSSHLNVRSRLVSTGQVSTGQVCRGVAIVRRPLCAAPPKAPGKTFVRSPPRHITASRPPLARLQVVMPASCRRPPPCVNAASRRMRVHWRRSAPGATTALRCSGRAPTAPCRGRSPPSATRPPRAGRREAPA